MAKKPTVYEFIPKLGQLRDDVLFGDVWEHKDLSKRDRIWMFGFSRGAFTIRVLAGLVHSQGLVEFETEAGTLINVNFPALPPDDVKGIRVCRQGLRDYGRLRIVQRTDPRGYDYYWFGLGPMVETPGHSTDLEAVADGYVSVSPLHLDLTHERSLAALGQRFDHQS